MIDAVYCRIRDIVANLTHIMRNRLRDEFSEDEVMQQGLGVIMQFDGDCVTIELPGITISYLEVRGGDGFESQHEIRQKLVAYGKDLIRVYGTIEQRHYADHLPRYGE